MYGSASRYLGALAISRYKFRNFFIEEDRMRLDKNNCV